MSIYQLTTKERVKTRLGITTTTWDGFFDALIYATTSRIEQMTGRRFEEEDFVELYDGSDVYGTPLTALILKNAPVTESPITLEYKAGNNSTPSWTAYSVNDFDIDEEMGVIHPNFTFPHGKQNIKATYTAGYVISFTGSYGVNSTHTLPLDITEVCEEVVTRLFKKRDSEGRSSESFQESSVTWNENVFTPENIATIKNYRRVGFI